MWLENREDIGWGKQLFMVMKKRKEMDSFRSRNGLSYSRVGS